MEIKDLRFFLAVYEQGGFSRAALALNTVQSNVTLRIRHLEDELQTRLFDRTADGARPTAEGRALHDYALRILQLTRDARTALSAVKERRTLRLGSMETTAAVRLPGLLPAFHGAYPTVALSLTTGPTDMLVDKVLSGELDGAFVAGPVANSALRQSLAFTERLCLVAARDGGPPPDPADLPGKTLIVFRAGCSYRRTLEIFMEAQGGGGPVMEFGSLDGILGCVAAGMGVSLLPESVAGSHRLSGQLHCVPAPAPFAEVATCFIHLPSAANPHLAAFVAHVRAHTAA